MPRSKTVCVIPLSSLRSRLPAANFSEFHTKGRDGNRSLLSRIDNPPSHGISRQRVANAQINGDRSTAQVSIGIYRVFVIFRMPDVTLPLRNSAIPFPPLPSEQGSVLRMHRI